MTYDPSPMPAQQQAQQDRQRVQRPSWQGPNYIPATVEGEVIRREPVSIKPMPTSPSESGRQAKRITTITPERTAQAFVIRTSRISSMTALAVALIWILVFWALPRTAGVHSVSLVAVGAMAILAAFGAFLAVWLIAYIIDMALSPGAVEMYEAMRTQRRIDAQSGAMVEAYRKAHQLEEKKS